MTTLFKNILHKNLRDVALYGGVVSIVLQLAFMPLQSVRSQDVLYDRARLESEFRTPPREFTLLPFWFWNDELSKEELAKQIASFEERGVYGFTIHPRIGLPEDTGWMSPKLLELMRFALEEARKRDMLVMLYDDGMYPSGSSAGQVVAEDPAYAARGFLRVEVDANDVPKDPKIKIEDDWNYVGLYRNERGIRFAIYDAPSGGVIRGLHYLGDESKNPREFSPPAADLLNPDAVDAFIRLVYQRYYDEFQEFFEDGTVVGVFTDEPSILGRGPRSGMKEGNLASLEAISQELGYDFKPYLLDLWEDVDSGSANRRAQYAMAVKRVLEKVYYGRISQWCLAHGTKLCGHPELSTDVGVLRQFQTPGQDIVWRYIEPGEKAFDPTHSPMAKGASSVALHIGARRNLNEVFGAYGHEFTYDEMNWIVNWCVVRGQNMFLPHAFYYSIRGPRWEERPPDVGPHSVWWDKYKIFADYCSRLCWLNTDSKPSVATAILVDSAQCSAYATRPLFEEQLDFNYLELRSIVENGVVGKDAVSIIPPGQDAPTVVYKTLILTPDCAVSREYEALLQKLADSELLLCVGKTKDFPGSVKAANDAEVIAAVKDRSGVDVETIRGDSKGLRVRHVVKGKVDFYFLFNEGETPLDVALTFAADNGDKKVEIWDPLTGVVEAVERNTSAPQVFELRLGPHETTIRTFE